MMTNSGSKPKAIDLFCGAGGLSLGLENAGWEITAAVDSDPRVSETHKANFPNTEFLQMDVREMSFEVFRGTELIVGGPPCQPFSVAGKQRSFEDSRDMVPDFIRAIAEAHPDAFLMENVPGLATKRHSGYLNWVVDQFVGLGYTAYVRILNAADYGVPQNRKRIFIIGVRPNLSFGFPEPSHGPDRPHAHVTAGEALRDVPEDEPNSAKIVYATKPVMRPSPWAGMLVNGQGRPINLDRPSQTIPATAGGYRTHILDTDGVLLEYHTRLLAGEDPRKGEVQGARRITTKESARLQSFPDKFEFVGPKSTRYWLIGNAVPPLLARVLGESLLASVLKLDTVAFEGDYCQLWRDGKDVSPWLTKRRMILRMKGMNTT